MPRRASREQKASRVKRAEFAEVEFTAPVVPRLVIRFGDGLSVLVEDGRSIPLAAAFIVEFRRFRKNLNLKFKGQTI